MAMVCSFLMCAREAPTLFFEAVPMDRPYRDAALSGADTAGLHSKSEKLFNFGPILRLIILLAAIVTDVSRKTLNERNLLTILIVFLGCDPLWMRFPGFTEHTFHGCLLRIRWSAS
jgi:hypothetical protein